MNTTCFMHRISANHGYLAHMHFSVTKLLFKSYRNSPKIPVDDPHSSSPHQPYSKPKTYQRHA